MARYRKHVISKGDTIQGISDRYTGNINLWRKIVEHNNLRHPYIVETTEEKLKNLESLVTIGDTIIIPIEQNTLHLGAQKFNTGEKDIIMELSLGSDISGTENNTLHQNQGTRDEVFELSANGRGDIALAKGVDNVKQAVIARLLTRRGSLTNHPSYGSELESLIGSPINMMTLKLVDDEILRTIKKDERVSSVRKVHSELVEETYRGEFEAYIASIDELFAIVIEEYEEGIRVA